MKRTLLLITLAAALTSCQNPDDTRKAVAITSTALDILVYKKVLSPEDAALAKATGQILIDPAPPPPPSPSGK